MTAVQNKRSWEQAIEDMVTQTETKVLHAITYLNEEIVPEVRRDSAQALRAAAMQLNKLADHMENRRGTERVGNAANRGSHSTEPAWSAASR